MGRNAEIETESEVLKRIASLLFAFAHLANRASGQSYPVRCLVLWFLRQAEVVARDWITAGSAEDMQSALSACAVLHRNSRAEALHLAQAFRALARMLRLQLCFEERFARRLTCGKANRATAGQHPRGLRALNTLCRLARGMRGAMRCLGFEDAPRFDTS